jgi:mono/diheme cytochrome c family protein
MARRRRRLILLALLPFVLIGGALAVIYSGAYDVAATRQHTAPVYWLFTTALRQSIQAHAAREAPQPPDLADPGLVETGLVLYDRNCVPCHGAPGVAPHAIGLGMTPPPSNLVLQARGWRAREIYWTVSNGLKMTGMPAWEFRMTERERWAVVAFVKALATLAPAEYRAERARLMPARAGEGKP